MDNSSIDDALTTYTSARENLMLQRAAALATLKRIDEVLKLHDLEEGTEEPVNSPPAGTPTKTRGRSTARNGGRKKDTSAMVAAPVTGTDLASAIKAVLRSSPDQTTAQIYDGIASKLPEKPPRKKVYDRISYLKNKTHELRASGSRGLQRYRLAAHARA